MKCLDTPYFTDVSFVPPFPSIDHSGSQSIMTTLFMHLLFCIHNSSWKDSRIIINSSYQPLVSHNNTCTISIHSRNASQHLHPYLCMHIYNIYSNFLYASIQCITTRFIKYLNAYPLNSTLYSFKHTMALTRTTSYRMHYYNQDHQSSLVLVIKFISTFTGHDILLYECSINFK